MEESKQPTCSCPLRIAVDIGSTVVKVAQIGSRDELLRQDFYPRDFEAGIATQVESILEQIHPPPNRNSVLICSSANGGLRVGIVSLTKHFSGAAIRNQVLLAGANPIFVHDLDEGCGELTPVDILVVGGGIDCPEAVPLESRLRCFKPADYSFSSLLYAGNRYLSELFVRMFPKAAVIPNPLSDGLLSKKNSVFEVVRRAYLDDLVYKEGVSELRNNLYKNIRPTPEVVNRGFQRATCNCSDLEIVGACVLIDIGGATTDLHYSAEIIREDSIEKPPLGSSVARYVFTDLGIAASHDSTMLQIRSHPRLHEFLSRVVRGQEVRDLYRLLREGEYEPSSELLSYACFFLALDRFANGRGPGLPMADLSKVSQIVLTGGAVQSLDIDFLTQLFKLFVPHGGSNPRVSIDYRYQVWVDGITWFAGTSV